MKPITKPYLRRLRNQVDLRWLMVDVLDLQHRHTGGRFRFLCPQCRGFDTGVNAASNLGRCFTCLQNFNPIDLVILVKHYDFLEAVDFLARFLPDEDVDHTPASGVDPP